MKEINFLKAAGYHDFVKYNIKRVIANKDVIDNMIYLEVCGDMGIEAHLSEEDMFDVSEFQIELDTYEKGMTECPSCGAVLFDGDGCYRCGFVTEEYLDSQEEN